MPPPFHIARSTLVCLTLAAVPASGQTGEVLTLERAIEIATASSRPVQIADLDRQKAADDVAALRARRRPAFDLKGLEGGFLSPVQFRFPQGSLGTYTATGPIPFADTTVDSPRRLSTAIMFTAIQPITQLRKLTHGETLLKLGGDIAAEKTRERLQGVIADVRRAYYGLQQTRAGLAAMREAMTQLDELDRVVTQYVEKEVALPGDQLSVRTERARADRDELVLRNLQATLTERINVLLGRDLTTPFVVADVLPANEPGDMTAAAARAKAVRPAIREAELNVQRATEDLRLHALDRRPDVAIGFAYLRLINVGVLPRNVAAVSAIVTWEPFDWGRRKAETDARGRTLAKAKLGLAEAQALVELDVRVKFRALAEAQETLRVARLSRDAAAEALRVATNRFRVEAILFKDVLAAQTAMAQATQAHQHALGAFWTARAELDQAVGDQP